MKRKKTGYDPEVEGKEKRIKDWMSPRLRRWKYRNEEEKTDCD